MIEGVDAISFTEPWRPCSAGLEIELGKEIPTGHVLSGIEAISIGRRIDNDDALFALKNFDKPLAVVHLTWSGRNEADPRFPFTRLYDSIDQWVEECMKPESAAYAEDSTD